MNTRRNKGRIYTLFYHRFHGERPWRSKEEQAWLDVAPVGREFGSPDYERLQVLDIYAAGQMEWAETIRKLGIGSLEELEQQMQAAGLTLAARID